MSETSSKAGRQPSDLLVADLIKTLSLYRSPFTLGIQVPSQKVFGVGLEGPGAVPEVRYDWILVKI